MTATDAQTRNRGLDRKRATSPASAFFVAGAAEPTLSSNPRQDLRSIGIVVPLPSSDGHATATISDRPIVLGAGVPCARSAHGGPSMGAATKERSAPRQYSGTKRPDIILDTQASDLTDELECHRVGNRTQRKITCSAGRRAHRRTTRHRSQRTSRASGLPSG